MFETNLKRPAEQIPGDVKTEMFGRGDLRSEVNKYEGVGSDLPPVTGDDDGKVLTVVDGAWAPAEASGGSEPFIITVTRSGNNYTVDKTSQQILNAYNNAPETIAIRIIDEGNRNYCYTKNFNAQVQFSGDVWISVLAINSYMATANFILNGYQLKTNANSDTVEVVFYNSQLPVVAAADNNKVLTVVSGKWTAAELPSP